MTARIADETLPLWPEGVPGKLGDGTEDNPWLELYRAPNATGAAVLICPGGGYTRRAQHEAEPVAWWLNTLGITGIVVHYRVAPYRHPEPLNDLTRAMRITRSNAAKWEIDPGRVGVLGFSAGGHLAATLSTKYDGQTRPDFSILLYAVITLHPPSAHTGSRNNLLRDPSDPDLINLLSHERHVNLQTPPTFMFHTADDPAVPIENALIYAQALRAHGVPFELHAFEHGRHGVGLAQDDPVLGMWPTLCANWLRARGLAR
ncbi:MAG: alpha/beta hydrolase [Burkholderiales bacterium]|nr:alpha/beta hydrolase [Phycisphaerae bacterium]